MSRRALSRDLPHIAHEDHPDVPAAPCPPTPGRGDTPVRADMHLLCRSRCWNPERMSWASVARPRRSVT